MNRFKIWLWRRRREIPVGAAIGALAWIGLMALGVPELAGYRGHDFTPVAAVLGGVLWASRGRIVVIAGTVAIAAVIAFVAWTPVMDAPLHALIRADAPPEESAQAVYVLAEGVTTDSLLTLPALDRTLYGVELVRSGIAPLLVLSTYHMETGRRVVSPLADQLHLARLLGVDSARVVVVDSVASTRDEAVLGQRVLGARGITRIAVVTSPAHSSRACRAFERVGFVVTCMPARSRDVPIGREALYRTRDRLRAFGLWLYERVATSYYTRRGWI